MIKRGYQQSQGDHTLLINHVTQSKVIVLIVYVDDIVVIGDDLEEIGKLREYLANEFEVKDHGSLRNFLEIEVTRSK